MEPQFAQRIETIQRPADPSTLQATAPIRVALFRSEADAESPRIIEVADVPLYYTVEDFARAFWLQMGKSDDYVPDNVFFGVPQRTEAEGAQLWYVNLKTLAYAGKQKEVLGLRSPYRRTLYKEYVGKEGERLPLKTYDRRKISLEDIFYGDERIPTLHAYPLAGVLEAYGGRGAISEKVWNGAVYPFYGLEDARTLKASERVAMTRTVEEKRAQLGAISRALESTPIVRQEEYALAARGIKQISYLWSKKPVEFPGVDMIFYNCDVNQVRPFMRYYPKAGTVINKLFQPDPMEPAYVDDPLLLRSWAAEKSPSPNDDFLMMKTEIRRSEPPLYGTFRVNGDGSADFIMLPPKTVRVLDPVYDLSRFYNSIAGTIEGTSYKIEDAQFYRGTFIYELKVPASEKKMTKEQIAGRVANISRYFQINAPHKDKAKKDNTFIMLRYKAVSNYAKEDDVELFITQWMEKGGDILTRDGLEAVMLEFSMEESAASEAIKNYMDKRGQFGIADEEDKHFVAAFNPGIDINIYYDNYSTFTFHIYRIDSLSHLQRLAALLQLLFLSSDSTWAIQTAAVEEDEEEVEAEDESEDLSNISIDSNIVDLRKKRSGPPPPPPASKKKAATGEEEEEEEELNPIVSADCEEVKKTKLSPEKSKEFFMDNLKQVDRVLTDYTSLPKYKGKGFKSYSTKCQVNDFRQPLALTKAQFNQIKEIYEEDLKTDMAFIVYGTPAYQTDLKNAKKIQQKALRESPYQPDILTVLRYGSDPRNLNYYICAEYVCIKDKIIIRKRDFKSNKKRDGSTPKPGLDITRVPEEQWEEGKYKGVGSCPFCCGSLIQDKKSPGLGETVLQRMKKKQGKVPQLDIGFLDKDPHPDGYGLPCCFAPKADKKGKMYDGLKWDGQAFKHIRDEEEKAAAVDVSTTMKKGAAPTVVQKGQKTKDLSLLRTEIHREYIADETKYPANYGSVAKATAALDTYFGQKSEQIVAREKQRQVINPQAYGFMRVGVNQEFQSSKRSFFAALAPILGRNSIEEIIQDFAIGDDGISQVIKPHIYANLNFGNLLLEFFNPGDYDKYMNDNELQLSLEQFKEVLQSFSTEYLSAAPVNAFRYELIRLFLSYRRFIEYVRGKTADRLQYRHFFHMLAERGLFVRNTADEESKKSVNGLTIIVLEYEGDPTDPTSKVRVRCPPYGFDIERYEKNDVCFMTVDSAGFWEPLLFVEPVEIGSTQRQAYYRIPYQKFTKATGSPGALPQNIRERFFEFRNKCSTGTVYRGIYSAQVGIDSSTLTPLSFITDSLVKTQRPVEGLLRDAYNHLVGAVISYDAKRPNTSIIIPASDDGDMRYFDSIKKILFGFDPKMEKGIYQYKTYADAEEVYNFYNGPEMERIQAKNPGYAFKSFVCIPKKNAPPPPIGMPRTLSCEGGAVIAYRLQNGILLPCRLSGYNELRAKMKSKFASLTFEPIPYSAEFTFTQDRKIIREALTLDERKTQDATKQIDKDVLNREDLEEIYTHFRLTFSNWLRSDDAGSALRSRIRKLLLERGDISSAEKRLILQYVFGPLLQSWILQRDDEDTQEHFTSLIRKDCRLILYKDQCDGHCGWKEDEGRCMLHVPSSIDLETGAEAETIGNVTEYFIQRLLYELVHIPLAYNEIVSGSIPRFAPLKTNIHIEGRSEVKDQWVIPDNVPAWHDLLYDPLAGASAAAEKPRFYEEFSDERGLQAQERTDELLEAVFGPAVASQLVVKKIGAANTSGSAHGPARDVLLYHDVLDQALTLNEALTLNQANRAVWTDSVLKADAPLDADHLKSLSALIGNYPIVFINGTNNEVSYGLHMTTQAKKGQVHIIIYNKNEADNYEASVVVPYGLLLEYVPLDRLQGTEIYTMIQEAPLVPRLVAPPPIRKGPVPPPPIMRATALEE